jgi:hypothetical protein
MGNVGPGNSVEIRKYEIFSRWPDKLEKSLSDSVPLNLHNGHGACAIAAVIRSLEIYGCEVCFKKIIGIKIHIDGPSGKSNFIQLI